MLEPILKRQSDAEAEAEVEADFIHLKIRLNPTLFPKKKKGKIDANESTNSAPAPILPILPTRRRCRHQFQPILYKLLIPPF